MEASPGQRNRGLRPHRHWDPYPLSTWSIRRCPVIQIVPRYNVIWWHVQLVLTCVLTEQPRPVGAVALWEATFFAFTLPLDQIESKTLGLEPIHRRLEYPTGEWLLPRRFGHGGIICPRGFCTWIENTFTSPVTKSPWTAWRRSVLKACWGHWHL